MDLSNLKPAEGSTQNVKRIGRGQGSGHGGTSTRGNKGAKQRSGYKSRRGFEGGQMPLQRVVPKFGFKNVNRKEFKAINLDSLQELAESLNLSTVDVNALVEAGLASKGDRVKILGDGILNLKLDVKAHAFSKKAKEAIEKQQGTTEIL